MSLSSFGIPKPHVRKYGSNLASFAVDDFVFNTPVGDETEHPGGASSRPEIPIFDGKLDECLERAHHGKSAKVDYRTEKFYDANGSDIYRRRSREFSGSPHSKRRSSRNRRRYSSSDSYEVRHPTVPGIHNAVVSCIDYELFMVNV